MKSSIQLISSLAVSPIPASARYLSRRALSKTNVYKPKFPGSAYAVLLLLKYWNGFKKIAEILFFRNVLAETPNDVRIPRTNELAVNRLLSGLQP